MSYEKYLSLRKRYPRFIYEDFSFNESEQGFNCTFYYTVEGLEETIPIIHRFNLDRVSSENIPPSLIRNLVFHVGLVETINYWKAVCSPKLIIKPYGLDADSLRWWEKLFFHGLGEFLFRNDIYQNLRSGEFIEISCEAAGKVLPGPSEIKLSGNLIPVGGGKDSIVTLELLKELKDDNEIFLLNPKKAAMDSAEYAGYTESRILKGYRIFDTKLFEMNKGSFLNGHVPYSAILAFCSVLGAILKGRKYIVLSNEGSANEPTVPGTMVNHQYSKTFEFEKDFNHYVRTNISPSVHYFSLLRPWSETRITAEFAKLPGFHGVFRSCNKGSKDNIWCCSCPKCLFVFIMLSAHMGIDRTSRIFGSNLFEDEILIPVLDELTGLLPVKPFECVGTVSETVYCLDKICEESGEGLKKPLLIRHFEGIRKNIELLPVVLIDRHSENLIPEMFKKYIFWE